MRTNRQNLLSGRLESSGFSQLVQEATHIQGGIIDHVYLKQGEVEYNADILLYSPYYTAFDHDALLVTLEDLEDSSVKADNLEEQQCCERFVRQIAKTRREAKESKSGS